MKRKIWYDLSLFGESDLGGESTPELTRQATGAENEGNTPVAEEQTIEARREGFRSLMEGEYKDLFQAFFQETFNKRFKAQKSMMEELERARGVIDAAADRYGTRDVEALAAAIRAEERKSAPTEATAGPALREAPSTAEQENIDAVIKAAVERAREETERAVTESIRARGMRPAESALTPGVGAPLGSGASRLTRAERAEMARRAARGERIEF